MSKTDMKQWYLDNYQKFNKIVGNDFFSKERETATKRFKVKDFPTKKDEDWKYTNISPILKNEYIPSPLLETSSEEVTQSDIDKIKIPNLDANILVFVNGIFNQKLSDPVISENGIIVDSLKNITDSKSSVLENINVNIGSPEHSFSLLNNSFIYDGFVIYIPQNKIIEKPVHIINVSTGNNYPLNQLKNYIIAEENSQAKIINEYVSLNSSNYFTNISTNIFIGRSANVTFYKLQDEDNNAFHIDKTDIQQEESSTFNHFSLSFGAKIARGDINTKLNGENIELHLYGLYLGNEDQLIDHHTFIDHAYPNCESNELYKGILDDRAKGVFSGKIYVNKIAQKTNAFQSNKSVLLSDDASVDSKPQLEIYADDVKCSHGATVGKLDEEAFFYIRSRGVPEEAARSMLIRAFVDDIVNNILIDDLKEKVNHKIFEHLHREEF